jgi:hypothetical protein
VRYGRKVSGIGYSGRFAHPSLQINLDCCHGRTICLQHTGAIQVMRNNVNLGINIRAEGDPVEVLMKDNNKYFFENAGQDTSNFRTNACL